MVLFGFLFLLNAFAEYRVFELVISDPATQKTKTVVSNLDPEQYAKYYHVPLGWTISYQKTWMCKGRTGDFKPFCTDSRVPASEKTSLSPAPPQ